MITDESLGLIVEGDAVVCFNYRADRVRQITRVLTRRSDLIMNSGGRASFQKSAELDAEIPLASVPSDPHYVTMTQHDPKFALPMVIFRA